MPPSRRSAPSRREERPRTGCRLPLRPSSAHSSPRVPAVARRPSGSSTLAPARAVAICLLREIAQRCGGPRSEEGRLASEVHSQTLASATLPLTEHVGGQVGRSHLTSDLAAVALRGDPQALGLPRRLRRVGRLGNQDEVRRKIFLSKDDPAAALAALRLLISHADEDEPDHPPRGDAAQSACTTRPEAAPG